MKGDIEEEIRRINPNAEEEVTVLAKKIREKSLKEPGKVVDILHTGTEEERIRAAMVLFELGDLAMTPLINSLNHENPDALVWDVETIASFHMENRSRIVAVLDKMLDDKRVLKKPKFDVPIEEEEALPTRRVCDEAYLIMRKLFAISEDDDELLTNEGVYLDMSDEERDAEIERAKKTKKWISLYEKALEDIRLEGDEFQD